ncbi:MAG: AAA family ATPase [Woeseiaceae bacterium]|nr:AAA family ATPase [Woeseiaceae bacterium]
MDPEDIGLESIESAEALVGSLSHRSAYDHRVGNIRVLDTHISWIVLTGDFAYKIKKPVKLDFLDYSTLEKRKCCCELEVELNRRWAPDIYLDVVPICGSRGSLIVGGTGTPIEYAVRMNQFPQDAQLDAQLAAGLLVNKDMVELAEKVAGIHAAIPVYVASSGEGFLAAIRRQMFDNFDYLQDGIDQDDVQRLLAWTRQSLDDCRETLLARYETGFVRECHGDLHLRNLVRLPSGVTPYDCVEFSVELRNIDVVSDVSFLVMDLVARGERRLAYAFINRYLECTGDYAGVTVLGLYFVYHALIRAKIAVIRAIERKHETSRRHDRKETAHYCNVARWWTDFGTPRLIIMHGFSGSGKTWLSQQLMLRLSAIRVRSDIERKRMHGLREAERSGSAVGQGLYGPATSAGLYERLAGFAESILGTGHNVIVDAAFLDRGERDRFRELAERVGSEFVIISTSAARDELHRRVETRQRIGGDPSEADAAVLGHQFDHADALDADERDSVIEVATDRPVDFDKVCKLIV